MVWIRKDSWPEDVHCPRLCMQWNAGKSHSETWCWYSAVVQWVYPPLFARCCVERIEFFAWAHRRLVWRLPGRQARIRRRTSQAVQKRKGWTGSAILRMEEERT